MNKTVFISLLLCMLAGSMFAETNTQGIDSEQAQSQQWYYGDWYGQTRAEGVNFYMLVKIKGNSISYRMYSQYPGGGAVPADDTYDGAYTKLNGANFKDKLPRLRFKVTNEYTSFNITLKLNKAKNVIICDEITLTRKKW